jgi:hypothetical protein
VSCNGTTALPAGQNPTAVGTTTYTLLVTNEDAGGASTTAQATVNCDGTLDPSNISGGGACSKAQFYCEGTGVAIGTPSLALATDACNACLGGSCGSTLAADGTAGAEAATGTGSAGTDYYVYSNALSTPDALCTTPAYTPAAGQVFSDNAGACASGSW